MPTRARRTMDQLRANLRLSWWVPRGGVVMAAIAALGLGFTVWSTERCLTKAHEVVVRGDGETLMAKVIAELGGVPTVPSQQALQEVLDRHEAEGLRFIALVDRKERHALVKVGTNAVHQRASFPNELQHQGNRFKLVSFVVPPWVMPQDPASGLPSQDARPYLGIEFEPPVIDRLQTDVVRIAVVATVVAFVLLTFALAWSRGLTRLAVIEQQNELERRLVALGRASAVIAHEFRNPLAVLKGHAQLLQEEASGPSRASATRVVEGAERLEQLTTVLLDFVRDGPLDLRPVAPEELIGRAVSAPMSSRVKVDVSHAPAMLRIDVERTALALRNLIENGVQASEAGTEPVEVRIASEQTSVVIEVRDHGTGLGAEAERQIFEPFVTTKAKGTGLGLSIARRIAEQHRGSLTGHTHSAGGAVFRMVLPEAGASA